MERSDLRATMAIFSGLSFYLGSFPMRTKTELSSALKAHGASVSFTVSKQTAYVILPDEEAQRGTSVAFLNAVKYSIDIVSSAYVDACVQAGALLDLDPFALRRSSSSKGSFATVRVPLESAEQLAEPVLREIPVEVSCNDPPPNSFEAFATHFDLLRQHTLQRRLDDQHTDVTHAELHAALSAGNVRVFRVWVQEVCLPADSLPGTCSYFMSLSSAEEHYAGTVDHADAQGFLRAVLNYPSLGSPKAAIEESTLSPELTNLVEAIYSDASHHALSALDLGRPLTLRTVEKAELALAQLHSCLDAGETPSASLLSSYFSLLPRKEGQRPVLESSEALAQEDALLQVMRDVLSVEETLGGRGVASDPQSGYTALGCQLTALSPDSSAFREVMTLLLSSNRRKLGFRVQTIYQILRPSETAAFAFEVSPRRLLFHGSSMSNWLGISSRGLLLPRHVGASGVRRTDAGMLGAGLYFASDASTAAQYCHLGKSGKRRLMLVAEVAVGRCKDMTRVDPSLRAPPVGYDSTRGVPSSGAVRTDFADEEFAVYSLNRQRMRYLIDFSLESDSAISFGDSAETSFDVLRASGGLPATDAKDVAEEVIPAVPLASFVGAAPGRIFTPMKELNPSNAAPAKDIPPSRLNAVQPPQEAGLVSKSGELIALRSIAVRSRVVDCVADVVLMQEYYNGSSSTLEAKYVFPLDETASVYGFEAFIMGKHVIGVCKEKEQARREYKEAISRGHGAYLMEKQAEEEVFTVSVGNLPPGETCVIKVMYVAELAFESGAVVFSLPAAVAPSAARAAIADRVQETTQTTSLIGSAIPLNLEISVESARSIRALRSPTHTLSVKRTDTRALVRLDDRATTAGDFKLQIYTESPHEPRMWIEEDGEHRCAMVSFFPSFEVGSSPVLDYTLLLDLSASMSKHALPTARRALVSVLRELSSDAFVNVVVFGSSSHALLSRSQQATRSLKDTLESLVLSQTQEASLGNTDLAGALAPLFAYAAATPGRLHNILLFSDGRVPRIEPVCALLQRGSAHARVFCFGAGPDASAHALRTLARWGGGSYMQVSYTRAMAHVTERRILQQLKRSAAPGLSSIRVRWGMHEELSAEAVPQRLFSLFSGDRQIVYAFTRATTAELRAKNSGEEVHEIVSATEDVRLRGRLLHRLAVRAMVNEHETGVYDESWAVHAAKKEAQKAPLIARSLEYGIVTPWTSFIAIEERTEGERRLIQPSLAELLEHETVDDMPYLAWPLPLRSTERLQSALVAHREGLCSEDEVTASKQAESAAETALAWLRAASALLANLGSTDDSADEVEELGSSISSLLETGAWRSPARSLLPSLIDSVTSLTASLSDTFASCPEAQRPIALDRLCSLATSLNGALEQLAKLHEPKKEEAVGRDYEFAEAEHALDRVYELLESVESAPAKSRKEVYKSVRDDVKSMLRNTRLQLRMLKGHKREDYIRTGLEELNAQFAKLTALITAAPLQAAAPDKAALVQWVAQRVPEVSVRNLSWNWSNGQILARLCAAIRPDDELLLLATQLAGMTREEACAAALAAAEAWLGVPPIVSATDMAMALNPTALANYVARLRDVGTGEIPLPPRPRKASGEAQLQIELVELVPLVSPVAPKEVVIKPLVECNSHWEQWQAQTFIRWANTFLVERMMKAESLFDLPDLLVDLLEIISSKTIPVAPRKGLHTMHRINRVSEVLRFIEMEGIKVVNIRAMDIAHGDRRQLMGLLWTVILRYQIQKASGGKDLSAKELDALLNQLDTNQPKLPASTEKLSLIDAEVVAAERMHVPDDEYYEGEFDDGDDEGVVRAKKVPMEPMMQARQMRQYDDLKCALDSARACASMRMEYACAKVMDEPIQCYDIEKKFSPLVDVGNGRYESKDKLIERARSSGEWWLIVIRFRLPSTLTSRPEQDTLRGVVGAIQHSYTACSWGEARYFIDGVDLAGHLWAIDALQSVLEGALEAVRKEGGEEVEVLSLHHASFALQVHEETIAAARAMRARVRADAEMACTRGVDLGLPFSARTELIDALRVPQGLFMHHCPQMWAMNFWMTVIAVIVLDAQLKSGGFYSGLSAIRHPLLVKLRDWQQSARAESDGPIKGLREMVTDIPFLNIRYVQQMTPEIM